MQEPVSLGPQERMFQGDAFRPGDLVWVVLSNPEDVAAQQQRSTAAVAVVSDTIMSDEAAPEAAPPAQSQRIQQSTDQHIPSMDAGPAFTAACAAIWAKGDAANAAAICRCIVQSFFLDSGCTATCCQDSPEQQAEAALHSTSGPPRESELYRRSCCEGWQFCMVSQDINVDF